MWARCQHQRSNSNLNRAFKSLVLTTLREEMIALKIAASNKNLTDGETSKISAPYRRRYSTQLSESRQSKSIFESSQSAWDHVFNDLPDQPPLIPIPNRNHLRLNPANELTRHQPQVRRQIMTAREHSVFDDIFNVIFSAASEVKPEQGNGEGVVGVGMKENSTIGDLLGKLRRRDKKIKWTSESDELLDRKKEEMDLCDTDQQLLEWAMVEVFGESKRYEQAARKAIEEGSLLGTEPPSLQPETYPQLLALLMRSFRDKFHDPHLALSIFDHARHLSIASYVFGCTTQPYNELIQTRWACFRDLKGVCDALEEMVVNGVPPDNRTRKLVEVLRRQVGERNLWEDEDGMGTGEVWEMLSRIESLILQKWPKGPGIALHNSEKKSPVKSGVLEDWKRKALAPQSNDGWEFGRWSFKDPSSNRGSQQRNSYDHSRIPDEEPSFS